MTFQRQKKILILFNKFVSHCLCQENCNSIERGLPFCFVNQKFSLAFWVQLLFWVILVMQTITLYNRCREMSLLSQSLCILATMYSISFWYNFYCLLYSAINCGSCLTWSTAWMQVPAPEPVPVCVMCREGRKERHFLAWLQLMHKVASSTSPPPSDSVWLHVPHR